MQTARVLQGIGVPRHTVSHHPESATRTAADPRSHAQRTSPGHRRRKSCTPSTDDPGRRASSGRRWKRRRKGHPHEHPFPRAIATAVVVAVDGSEQGYVAVRYTRRARHDVLGVPLDAIHMFLPSTATSLAGSAMAMMMMVPDESVRSYGAEILERARTTALETVPDLQVTTQLHMGGGRIHQLVTLAAHASLSGSRKPEPRQPRPHLDRWDGRDRCRQPGKPARWSSVPADGGPAAPHGRILAEFKSPAHAALSCSMRRSFWPTSSTPSWSCCTPGDSRASTTTPSSTGWMRSGGAVSRPS